VNPILEGRAISLTEPVVQVEGQELDLGSLGQGVTENGTQAHSIVVG
jgi:hypothetical protein